MGSLKRMTWRTSQVPNRGWSKRPTTQVESSVGQSRLIPSREKFLTFVAKWQQKFKKQVGVKPCLTRLKPGSAIPITDQIWKNLRGERNPSVVFKAFLGFKRRKREAKAYSNEIRTSPDERWEIKNKRIATAKKAEADALRAKEVPKPLNLVWVPEEDWFVDDVIGRAANRLRLKGVPLPPISFANTQRFLFPYYVAGQNLNQFVDHAYQLYLDGIIKFG